jgi:hypothetical protein
VSDLLKRRLRERGEWHGVFCWRVSIRRLRSLWRRLADLLRGQHLRPWEPMLSQHLLQCQTMWQGR